MERDPVPMEPIAINHMLAREYHWAPQVIDAMDEREASDYLTCIRLENVARNNMMERAREEAGRPRQTRPKRMSRKAVRREADEMGYTDVPEEVFAELQGWELTRD